MSTDNCLVKAIYSFKGKNNDELCFKKGDIITVTQKEEGGWWEGTLGETTGWFPSNYVTEYKDASGSLTTSPIRAASEIQAFRNVVLKDIIDSEKAHVAEMQGLVSNFLQPLEKSDMLTKDEFRQLTGNINEVLQVHEQFLTLLEECAMKTGPDQRVGGLFLQWAPKIKAVHQTYCAGHPKAVCILDKYKENLNTWMENAGAVCPGVLVLTAGLSKPFRRLGKYPAMLQELARHVHEAHPDRGDTHRASVVYKDIASACAALRRQKELELQVVTGEVRGWPGGELTSLGDVLHMGSVAVGPSHQDRYLVLFPSALLLLSVSKRVSAFVYEGCLPLTGITVCKLDDTETRKNAFEISGPMIDRIIAVCQTRAEADNWVSLLQKHSNNSSPSHDPTQPQSLPHLTRSPSEGALSSINSTRRSLYHVTLPPSSYPSASPYYSLTKYFARLVKKKVITRQMLRKLLHEKTWAKAFELTGYPVRRRHKNHINLKIDDDGTIATETECSDSDRNSEDSDREMETTDYSNSSCTDAEASSSNNNLIIRQNAMDSIGPRTISSSCSSWGSNFGYVRYFDTTNDMQCDMPQTTVVGDCTKNIFVSLPSETDLRDSNEYPVQRSSKANNLNVNQHSDSAENSSFEIRNYMGCEDLVNMDQNIQISNLGNEETDYIQTRRSFPNFIARNEPYPKLWKSNEEYYNREDDDNNNVIMADLLQVLDPPSPKHCRDFPVDPIIIDPPPMFRNEDEDLKILNVNLNANIPFRKHSINSDKRIRRSMSRSMVETDNNKKNNNPHLERMSSQSETSKVRRKCECCNRSLCPSPRSSDSGVAGSCNLASPDLNMHGTDSDSHEKTLDHMTDSLNNLSQNTFNHRKLTLSEIEAANYEDQCRCTSPFGSTARTSCVTSVTSESSFDVKDLSNTNVTSTFAANPPLSSSQIKRTSIRRHIDRYVPEIKLKPEVPPRIYRKPSTHMEFPKNVRQPMPCQWSTLNITERSKPSLHYHMRIYREKPNESNNRMSRKDISRNCDIYNKINKQSSDKSSAIPKTRSRSEDLSKMQNCLTEAQTGFMVYRSDLYAHWWMKAKLPITVVTDSGKDYFFCKGNCLCITGVKILLP
ncbi:jg9325 [Pararge aegeria aegeria]|uniref:Jg9325 protein n=1 Tax=Pararge aegeria aegeria TaxID=348720 RepID=A0A8S4RXN4_9NEOP|nr:jg9325 [Pararge aegeria aegeria]